MKKRAKHFSREAPWIAASYALSTSTAVAQPVDRAAHSSICSSSDSSMVYVLYPSSFSAFLAASVPATTASAKWVIGFRYSALAKKMLP